VAFQRALNAVSECLTLDIARGLALTTRVMTELSDVEIIDLFRQQLKVLREWRNNISAHITASQEMIKQSRALIVQLDEQINQMERELRWLGGRSERALLP
jgi:hypothetical protein